MGTYRTRRAITTTGIALWIAEYITAEGQVIELARSAVADYPCKLIARLTGRDTLMTRSF